MRPVLARAATITLAVPALGGPAAAAPEGTMTRGVHVTLAARWLEPGR
jgi:hypothetical protein